MANVERVTRRNISRNWVIFLMMAPTLVGIAIFSYGPAFEAIRHSFYNWDGAFTEEFVGMHNFRELLGNLGLWGALLGGGVCTFLSSVLAARQKTSRVLKTLGIMLTIALLGLPAVITYTVVIYRTFFGKVRLDEHSY